MRRSRLWIVGGLLLLAGVWYFRPGGGDAASPAGQTAQPLTAAAVASATPSSPATNAVRPSVLNTNRLAYRLANTPTALTNLMKEAHAILLQNALIDTTRPLNLDIPKALQAQGDPGAYIVQARGVIDARFRALLASVGARVVSYIPNNAYLVQVTPAGAGVLSGSGLVQAVLPYEPYYKLQPSLLGLAVTQSPLPPGTALTLGLFASDTAAATQQILQRGAVILDSAPSAMGPLLRVLAPADWPALAQVPGLRVMEVSRQRVPANDLTRAALGVAADTQTTTNFLGLTGKHVLVQVNDSGVDATHPDLTGRVFGFTPGDLVDTRGHGTHVAGTIAGDGTKSMTVTNAEGSIMPATNFQFRGMAPAATLLSINNNSHSDQVLQQVAASRNALISNSSWVYGGDFDYDLAAASYDAATRDALPFTTGSQPVLFVFAAGDSGGGRDDGAGGSADTIQSPGTAKNVITVGALELPRNITNIVTIIQDGTTNTSTPWANETDSGAQVAGYSARGNVGVGTEGAYGRFKPDVVAPGTFVVSTRSSQWDTNAFTTTTNVDVTPYPGQLVTTNGLNYYSVSVPANAVGVVISIFANKFSPNPFPADLPIYVAQTGIPGPVNADFTTAKDGVSIPNPDGGAGYLQQIQNNGFGFAVGNSTNVPVNYDMTVAIITTNNVGDYYLVLLGMDDSLGGFYRYETGTSMAAAGVSGTLALLEDYFTNTLSLNPSPALLKAMLINGARSAGSYSLAITNNINYQGWGLPSLPNTLPLTNNIPLSLAPNPALNAPMFFVDQSPLNALATGDRHTYLLTLDTNNFANYLSLKATLVWTDPPGDPAAAIKLVNGLTLVITNLDNQKVYYGNDIAFNVGYNRPASTNTPPNLDTINNVQNIVLNAQQELLAGSYSVTVVGRSVNVNAVTAQTNNVVQDYALVVSVGEGEVPSAITSVTDTPIVSNPTGSQNITFVTSTNTPLMNQFVGANTPLLGTNTQTLGTKTAWGASGQLTLGMTNQWHFYVVTNNALDANGNSSDVTNAAFITFSPYTLSIPRTGVNAGSVANATRPEADIDLYVSTDPTITNLNPVAISNCLAGTVAGTAVSYGASLTRGGTEFVYFTNSAPGQIYYIGVKSEDQMASEYAFLAVFTATPFGALDANGNLIVNGLLLPAQIPDGDNAHPGVVNVFALAIPLIPNMQAAKVTVTNLNEHQNFGDLFGALTFSTTTVVLNNGDGLGNTYNTLPRIYDDSPNHVTGTTNTDGPGSLMDFQGKSVIGPWILSEQDSGQTATGQVSVLNLLIQPHRDLTHGGVVVQVPPLGWFIDYVDVPPGYTNLLFAATNLPPTIQPKPLQMYERFGFEPTLLAYDLEADLTNCPPGFGPYPGQYPGNEISVGPPLDFGRYFIGIYNPDPNKSATVLLSATLGISTTANLTFNYATTNGTQPLLDDAVTDGTGVFVGATQNIASVSLGMVVNSPRISDLTFTLLSPTGQRILLMENRGAGDTNGAGSVLIYTNVLNTTATGGAAPNTNYLAVSPFGGVVPITYNFYTVPDEMTVYEGTNINPVFLIWDTGFTNNAAVGPGPQNTVPVTINVPYQPGFSNITIIMNQFGNPYAVGGDAWYYTAGAPATNYQYLVFTDDTNLATVPIKFAVPPFNNTESSTNYTLNDFEQATNGDYHGLTNIFDAFGGWTVPTNLVTISTVFSFTNNQFVQVTNVVRLTNNLVSVVTDPANSLGDHVGSNYLALANGTITRVISNTIPGHLYNVTFWFRGPNIASWWRGEGNASDSSDPENNGNNGALIGRFNFPAGEVGQAFDFGDGGNQFGFAGTNTYVQVPQNNSLDVGAGGGFTIEGWINPTNLAQPQPLVEWLAKVPTNPAVTNLVIQAGPYLNRATGHYYYLLGATNWTTSEFWAKQLGGHLATLDTANEQNWVFDNFANYGGRNRNLWIGLTNRLGAAFGYVNGLTNVTYTNWLATQPDNSCGTANYTFLFGGTNPPAGLWTLANNLGFTCAAPNKTNVVHGVAEVGEIQTNGVQFWVSVTNTPGTTNAGFFTGSLGSNGCLYANIVDTNFVAHEIFSAPGLLLTNVFQHVALTFDTNSGLARLYLNGTNVATTNLFLVGGVWTPFVPKTDGDVLLGRDMSRFTNNVYGGRMDEISIYRRALSLAEISAIYQVSAFATNGLTGKFDASVTPAYGLAEAEVVFGTTSNLLFGVNNQWQLNSYTFTAQSNTMPLRITGLQPGILLDDFSVAEAPLTNLYYLPEQSLESLVGTAAYGNWTLQVWDNRVNAAVTNLSQLVNWQLSFILESNALISASLSPQAPFSGTVGPGQTAYYAVPAPSWANRATNILVSSTLPVNLFYFSPTNIPTGANAADARLLTAAFSGIGNPVLSANPASTPQLYPGATYYLGVQNNGIHAAAVKLEVDFDITALTNGAPYSDKFGTNVNDTVRYYSFAVSSNAYEATFQLLKLSGNADLVVRKGVPLPDLTSSDYGSFNVSNLDESIYVLTNSAPVPLAAGTWYLGVIKRDSGAVSYSVLAKELDVTGTLTNSVTIIELTNGVPFNWTAGPGAALTNFFHFGVTNPVVGGVTNPVQGVRFELYNLAGNGDLTVQTNALPLAPPFFQSSLNPGRNPELVLIYTNLALTNLMADWYLGVPNNELTNISYTVRAAIETNGYFPAFPGAGGAGGGAAGAGGPVTDAGHGTNGTVYHVVSTADAGPGTLRDAVSSTNRTVVFDIAGTINLASPLVITNSYLTIAGQTAPCGGVTVAGYMTMVSSAHDVIIRNLRFRRGTVDDSLMLTNVANVIADHISAEWSTDNALSTLNSSNVTVQWSILSDTLYQTNNPPPTGSLLRYGSGALSFHHNLYADNYSGSPQVGDNINLDFVNNVIYNWGPFAGLSGGTNDLLVSTNGCTNQLNYVGNYLIAGPDTAAFATNYAITNIAFFGGTTNGLAANWIFQTNNFIDSDTNGILNGANTQWLMFTNQYTRFQQPFPLVPVPTDEAFLAYEKVLDFAGVNLCQRDTVDASIVSKVRTQTGTLIAYPPLSGLVSWWSGESNTLDSADGNTGTWTGLAGGNLNTYAPGKVGRAFVFDGKRRDRVNLGNPTNLQLQVFTIAAWVKRSDTNKISLDNLSQDGGTAAGGATFVGYGQNGYGLGMADDGRIFETKMGVDGVFSTPAITITDTNWHHVVAVKDAASVTLYLDGNPASPKTPYNSTFSFTSSISIGSRGDAQGGTFWGAIDEARIYKHALSAAEIASIYNAGSAGKFAAQAASPQTYLDTDQDGIPDFWEITFGQNPTNASNNQLSTNANFLGYTTLEEYLAWRAAPHALTVTNTPVGVDLMTIFGKTGNLSFWVTNAVNGSVYLTNVLNYTNTLGLVTAVTNTGPWSNSFAFFTPTNTTPPFSGYASFDVVVTNNDTVAYFGPVTVSVLVSAVPVAYVTNNTNPPPVFATNALANQTINELTLLTVTNNATDANTNLTLSYTVSLRIDTNAMNLLGWTNSFANTTNTVPVIDPNGIITWTPSEAQGPGVYIITTIVSDNGLPPATATNSFSVTVNEVNTAPFWPANVPSQTNYTIPALNLLVVTNTALDADLPINPLTYQLIAPPGAAIDTNGIITWTPTVAQAPGLYTFTTIVTDTNPPAMNATSLSATNSFTVNVTPVFPPFAFTQPATLVTGAAAQLNGMATANGLPATAWFEWGTDTGYGNQTPPLGVGGGYRVVYTTNQITGLALNVPYHYRLVVSNVVGVAYGFDQIFDEANVAAWGANYVGQINVRADLTNAVAVAGAYDHTLALTTGGQVLAWGDNTFGQANVPANLSNVVAIAGGLYYSAALKSSGTVAAWGTGLLNATNVPPGLSNVVQIAGGTYSGMALRNNGTVVVWGANFPGLLLVPPGASDSVAIAGGGYHSLAIKNNGTVTAWGDDSVGQTDLPAGLTNVVAVAGGSFHSLALRYNGTVVAWGDNTAGQTNVPAGLTNVVAIAAGGFHSLALKADGSVVMWGDNTAGQTSLPTGLTKFVAISAGYLHSLALTPQSVFNLTNLVLNLTNGLPQTNNILKGGVTYYQINVPTNATFATNTLLFALNGPLNVWFSTNVPPTVGGPNDALLLPGVTNGVSVLSTTSVPTNLVPGGTYYLGVQNPNNFAVNYAVQVDFHLVVTASPVQVSSVLSTNGGFLLTWFAPSNQLFQVQWSDRLPPVTWNTFANIIGYNTNYPASATNATFTFFDDGSQTGGFGGTRFYRLIPAGAAAPANTAPVLPPTAILTFNPLAPLVVNNAATDTDAPPQTLTYSLTSTVAGTNVPVINPATGVITWTPALAQAGTTNLLTTIVTDNGVPPLSATNALVVIVKPVPDIGGISFSNGVLLTWLAPTNDIFQVQFTDSLAPVVWQNFSNLVTYTGPATTTDGLFSFLDNGSEHPFTGPRFYQIKLVGVVSPPVPHTVAISSLIATNGNFLLTWLAPSTNQFNVRWATNLVPPFNWTTFANTITSTNGTFTFLDTNAPLLMKFYELILLP